MMNKLKKSYNKNKFIYILINILAFMVICNHFITIYLYNNILSIEGFKNNSYNGLCLFVSNNFYNLLKTLHLNNDIKLKNNCYIVIDTY